MLDAACTSGAAAPRALEVVGAGIGGRRGLGLVRVAARLRLGASWDEAWEGADGALRPVRVALRGSWEQGTPPAGALRSAAGTARVEAQAEALEAAGRLGVRLVLPLGLCFLPAFVLVGLVPVLLGMAGASLG
nr:type II secretion system F family protein [Cellulomonas sp. APG4]